MNQIHETEEDEELRLRLIGSFLLYIRTFFPLVTGRPFHLSKPIGRESHFVTVARELSLVKRLETLNLLMNLPPGYGKSIMISMFVTWCWAEFPDSQFLYISYGADLASKHTEFIRRVLTLPHYYETFGVTIDKTAKAKEQFKTNFGGGIKAFGAQGPITGQDAGLPGLERFSGAVLMDDLHKPDEVHSDTLRQKVIDNVIETIMPRPRGPNVPMIFIGQRLHEDDVAAFLLSDKCERKFKPVVLQALDEAGNALYPEVHTVDILREKQDKSPYVYSSQYQQEPVPKGGALYNVDRMLELDEEPKILATFITADTAETDKTWNDATAFSFWGVYEIEYNGQKTGQYSLHWLACDELWIEPDMLEQSFINFYNKCMLHPVKPLVAVIEKKSTGVTLCSVLKNMRGLKIVEVQRTKASGSKAVRHLEMQPIISAKMVTFTRGDKHVAHTKKHMSKITPNDTHEKDDICDTCYDAVKLVLIDGALGSLGISRQSSKVNQTLQSMAQDARTRL